jgi:hypothetical protein
VQIEDHKHKGVRGLHSPPQPPRVVNHS